MSIFAVIFFLVVACAKPPPPLPPPPPRPSDSDQDGIPDSMDVCPRLKGHNAADRRFVGCPDRDGDGVYDHEDACVDQKGKAWQSKSIHGCPIPRLYSDITFVSGRSILEKKALIELQKAAKQIQDYGEFGLFTVAVYHDGSENTSENQRLAERRAMKILEWLVTEAGISADRLQAQGYAQKLPRSPTMETSASHVMFIAVDHSEVGQQQ